MVDMMIIINDPVATGTNHKKTLNVCWSQKLVCTVNCVGGGKCPFLLLHRSQMNVL